MLKLRLRQLNSVSLGLALIFVASYIYTYRSRLFTFGGAQTTRYFTIVEGLILFLAMLGLAGSLAKSLPSRPIDKLIARVIAGLVLATMLGYIILAPLWLKF